jgi:peptidoglycan/xylan/chitin deacetylase (PgdA/CDA1 family)
MIERRRRPRAIAAGLVAAALALLAACGSDDDGGRSSATTAPAPTTTTTTLPDPASVGANELGVVPILMYHRLLPEGGGQYDGTPEQLRTELQRLYDEGYRPVTTAEYASGRIDLAPGESPVVLTFDDGTRQQFGLLPDGTVDPATSIGILLDFAATHPGFRPVASLYLTGEPFGTARYEPLLQRLHELGFEIGNHTATHRGLGSLDGAAVQQELADQQRRLRAAVPGLALTTMALPLGSRPADPALGVAGAWNGEAYRHEAVLLVGAGPAPSPFDATFTPAAVPRIRSSPWDGGEPNYGSGFWLDQLRAHPERRYVSDGDPDRVSFPAAGGRQPSPAAAPRANPY